MIGIPLEMSITTNWQISGHETLKLFGRTWQRDGLTIHGNKNRTEMTATYAEREPMDFEREQPPKPASWPACLEAAQKLNWRWYEMGLYIKSRRNTSPSREFGYEEGHEV